jgi:hypothetical protein
VIYRVVYLTKTLNWGIYREVKKGKKVLITTLKYTKVPTTYKLCFGSIYPLNLAIWFNLSHNTICHFFSIHTLDFNLRLCEMVVDIIMYIREIFYEFS